MSDQTTNDQQDDELEEFSRTTGILSEEELGSLGEGVPDYISPTILAIPEKDRPDVSPACETCPAAMWFKTTQKLKCFCQRMHTVVWQTGMEELPILLCDGREMALMQMMEQE